MLDKTACDLAVGGAGLGLLPIYGELVSVMNDYAPDYGGVYAVYPRTRHLSLAGRSFIEFLVQYTEAIRHA